MRKSTIITIALASCAAGAMAQDLQRAPIDIDVVSTRSVEFGRFAYYVPPEPRDLAVLIHGYPWPDDSQPADSLLQHAKRYVTRWQPFGAEEGLILIAPAFGSGDFAGYRELFGRKIDADEFVNGLVDEFGGRFIEDFDRRFLLYGHSAGGQFAGRYLVMHPDRLKGVVLSAPSTCPVPDSSVAWPYGMAPVTRTADLSGSSETGKDPAKGAGDTYRPDPGGWVEAATHVPIMVLVGSADTEPRDARPGQIGHTRIARATSWVETMSRLAEIHGGDAVISLSLIDGIGHDPVALTEPAQRLLLEITRRAMWAKP